MLPVSSDKDTALLYHLPQGSLAVPPQGCCHAGVPAPALWMLNQLQVEGSQDNPCPARDCILHIALVGAHL